MTTAITDHELQASNRLRQQLRDTTTIPALVRALAEPSNALDAALIQLLLERSIDTAVGAQLDDIGDIVGITRAEIDSSLPDDDYRRYVRAKIWALNSEGIVEDVLRVMSLVVNDASASYILEQQFPASVVLRVEDVAVTASIASIAAQFLRDCVAAGVRALFEFAEDVPAEMFTFATFTPLDGLHGVGVNSLTVDDTSRFPDSGSLDLNSGLANEENIAYTSKTATTFTLGDVTTFAHVDNSAVQLSGGPGKGFGNEAQPTQGGKFAGAKEG